MQGRWSIDRSVSNVRTTGVWVCLIWRATGLLKDLHTCWSLTGDAVWRRKASRTFPRLKSDPKAEGRCKTLGETFFVCECRTALRNLPGSSDLSRPWKELYRELVVGSASDPLSERWGWTAEIRSHWNWAPDSSFLNNSEFSLTLNFRAGLADMSDCARCGSGLEDDWSHLLLPRAGSPVLGSRRGVDGSHRTQAARAARLWLRCGQHSSSVSGWEAWGISHDPRCSSNGDLADAKEGLYDDANFSHRDLVLYFRHQVGWMQWAGW